MKSGMLSKRFWRGALGGLCLLSLVLVPGGPAVAEERPDPDPARFEQQIAAFEAWDRKNAWPEKPILFVGSSSIRMWNTHESFPDRPVINRGFGGAHISDVLHFADRVVAPYPAPIIVFYCGDNDIASAKSPERVLADFKTFVAYVHQRRPDTRIVYLPIKPSGSRWQYWPQMKAANDLIAQICADNGKLRYVDTATPLLGSDGKPQDNLFLADRLHLNEEGYKVWTGILEPVLAQLQGKP